MIGLEDSMTRSCGQTREERLELTRVALAQAVSKRMIARRLRQTHIARQSGISRSFLRSILRAEKGCSLFVFLELNRALAAEPSELLRDVLHRRGDLHGSTPDQ